MDKTQLVADFTDSHRTVRRAIASTGGFVYPDPPGDGERAVRRSLAEDDPDDRP